MNGAFSRADRAFKAEQAERAILKDWSRIFECTRMQCERLTEGKADRDGGYLHAKTQCHFLLSTRMPLPILVFLS